MPRLTLKDVNEKVEDLYQRRNTYEDEKFSAILSALGSLANKVSDNYNVEEALLRAVHAEEQAEGMHKTIEFLLKQIQEIRQALKELEARKQDKMPILEELGHEVPE
jgi:uncharacterized protein involved in exopolysaccharide biosynthesis